MRRVRIRTFPQRGRSPTALRWGAALRDHDHRRGSDRLERKSPRRPEHDHQGRSSLCDAKHRHGQTAPGLHEGPLRRRGEGARG